MPPKRTGEPPSCRSWSGIVVLACLAATSPGCDSTPQRTALMRQSPEVVASASELRIRMRVYANRFAHIVEDGADRIITRSEDRTARWAALEWKSKAIPQAQTSCFHSDPMAALFDTWALAIQQRQYFEDPAAAGRFGEDLPVALAAALTIEEEVEDIARDIKRDGDISKSRAFVEQWASAHPVEGEWLRRRSILDQLAACLAADDLGVMATVGRLSEDLSDLAMRASLYNEMLPRQARWQAELMTHELGLPELQEVALETVPRLTALAERAVVVAEGVAELVRQEREILLEQLTREREAIQDFVEASRAETLAHLGREREVLVAVLHEELTRVLQAVSDEREAVLEGTGRIVEAQWSAIRDDLPQLTGRSLEQTLDPIGELIDHGILRMAQLGGAGLAGLLLLGLVFLKASRR